MINFYRDNLYKPFQFQFIYSLGQTVKIAYFVQVLIFRSILEWKRLYFEMFL